MPCQSRPSISRLDPDRRATRQGSHGTPKLASRRPRHDAWRLQPPIDVPRRRAAGTMNERTGITSCEPARAIA